MRSVLRRGRPARPSGWGARPRQAAGRAGFAVSVAVLGVLTPFALAGCGGGSESAAERKAESESEAEAAAEAGAPQPVCVDEAETSDAHVPSAFPSDFPLPDGAVVYASQERSGGRVIVYAVVDADVKAVLKQLQTAVPGAGFELTEGEVEERDAESNWTGNGYTGRWAIREVADCTDQTSVTVLAAKG